ncbi:DMT family transporter [Sphaerochaeta sp. PS]|uniref:DMT family transporter n=1 Tax=Sphaerochaeta sp. PS TaxID=3076336 RepID=UPI0028A5289B|nr:DMT family transporter [Sphaerochaeta sp. PS]MDT4762554.1 DMT family transporter [Sphaerochaeta sp. PS]
MSTTSGRTQIVARIEIIIAMVAFGTIGIFVRYIPLPSAEIALWRGIIAFLVLTLFMLTSGRLSGISKYRGKLGRLFFAGAAMGFNWILLFEAYRYTSVALSTLSYYFAPTIIIVGSSLIFRERLNAKQVVCFIVSTAGLALIIGVRGGGANDTIGVLFGLGAAVLYAFVFLTNKATPEFDGLTRTWIQFAAAIIVLTPYCTLVTGFHILELHASGLVNLLILGVVHTGLMYYLYFSALAHLKGQQVAILSYIDPIVAVLLSVAILHEGITLLQLAGGGLILGATLANELNRRPIVA